MNKNEHKVVMTKVSKISLSYNKNGQGVVRNNRFAADDLRNVKNDIAKTKQQLEHMRFEMKKFKHELSIKKKEFKISRHIRKYL